MTLAPDEVEIQAMPRPGTAVAHDEGIVVVLDTQLTPELRAEGDARELQRAIQDLRRDAALQLDDRITVWVDGLPAELAGLTDAIRLETLADELLSRPVPPDVASSVGPASARVARGRVGLRAVRIRSRWGSVATVHSAPPPVPSPAAERAADGAPPVQVGSAARPASQSDGFHFSRWSS